MGLKDSIVVKPSSWPLCLLHSFSFSNTWNKATTFLRQLSRVSTIDISWQPRLQTQTQTHLSTSTLPYVTDRRRISSSSGLAERARSKARTSSTPVALSGMDLPCMTSLKPEARSVLTWVSINDDTVQRSHLKGNLFNMAELCSYFSEKRRY